jgi:diaminohydroxyphosphoribosylaminopyrimidine deaminase/5-amino-6-(5-phosphoribosylamino)uracil reductase
MLAIASRAGWRGIGRVEPNPGVGAVIARGGEILSIGHHRVFGGLHAEAEAIQSCARRGIPTRGATMYVTLEPCASVGKQPACVDAIVSAGISRVVYAIDDPNPMKSGGAARLRAAGLEVECCTESRAARLLSEPFIKRITTGLPWVIAKWAQTIDGRVATRCGESKWISNEWSRARVHRLRSRVDAIITGIGTVLADDPLLTPRVAGRPRRTPHRVVCDTDLDIPLDSQLVRTARATRTSIVCAQELATAEITRGKRAALEAAGVGVIGVRAGAVGVDLGALLSVLWQSHGVSTAMVEAGPGLLGSFFDLQLVDEALVYIAPLLLGDEMARAAAAGRVAESLGAGRRMELVRVKALGSDVELWYRRIPRAG